MKRNDLILRRATVDDAYEIHDLMEEVFKELTDKSIFVCDDLEFVRARTSNKGVAVVACNSEQKIVGSFICGFPMDDEDNLGIDLGLTGDELYKVVNMESVVVHPDYRGNNLQYRMVRFVENLIDRERYKYLIGTVSPDNPPSYNNLEKLGYTYIKTMEKYGGLKRRIYCKKTDEL